MINSNKSEIVKLINHWQLFHLSMQIFFIFFVNLHYFYLVFNFILFYNLSLIFEGVFIFT